MLTWVIYDISDNRLRTRVSEKCKDYGMERLQKSAFLGDLSRNNSEMLAIEIEKILDDENTVEEDCVFFLPMCSSCISKKITIGRGFDEEEFKDKFYTFFE
jgi:CRISPR-associated protein Cas2